MSWNRKRWTSQGGDSYSGRASKRHKKRSRIRNPKAKGWRSERKSRLLLEKEGYYVIRAGGSLGMWDMVGVHPKGAVVFVQTKSNYPPGRAELNRLEEFNPGVHWKEIHVWKDYNPKPEIIPIADPHGSRVARQRPPL